MPDLFRGDPVPQDALSDPTSNYSLPDWQKRHPMYEIESIIDTTLASIRTTYNATKIGSVGYCFGGKYVARYLAEGKGIDAGFAAHREGVDGLDPDLVHVISIHLRTDGIPVPPVGTRAHPHHPPWVIPSRRWCARFEPSTKRRHRVGPPIRSRPVPAAPCVGRAAL